MPKPSFPSPHYHRAQWILPIDAAPIEDGFLSVSGNQIEHLGAYTESVAPATCPPPEAHTLITPGLINTHLHLEQSFPQPVPKAEQEDFVDWLLKVIQINRQAGSSGEKLARCRWGVQQCLQAGVTCVNDVASGPESIQAIDEGGLRALVALEVFHPGFDPILIEGWLNAYQVLLQRITASQRIQLGLSPHSLYNVSPEAWQAMVNRFSPGFIHTHLAEFEEELAYIAQAPSAIHRLHQQVLGQHFTVRQPASSPVQALIEANLLRQWTILAHAIHTSPADRKDLQGKPVGIAHCPRSNLALHGRTLHWADWQTLLVPIGLGTDGGLSTPDLDLRAEARFAQNLHGWTGQQTLRILTQGGADALGQGDRLGSLTPGKQADWVLWQACPETDHLPPADRVLEPSTKVQAVMIDGQWRYQLALRAEAV